MRKQFKQIFNLFIRYFLIFVAGLGNLWIFYKIFTPLTLNAVSLILSIFYKTSISGSLIISEKIIIELIPACVAGAAYYLLFLLVLATPDIKFMKRVLLLAISFASLFILNTSRILILSAMTYTSYFETTHLIFWYGISTIFVVGIWITLIKIFKIKKVPIYSDIKFLWKLINPVKNTKRRK